MVTREEHLARCKQEAIARLEAGDLTGAIASMISDLRKSERPPVRCDSVAGAPRRGPGPSQPRRTKSGPGSTASTDVSFQRAGIRMPTLSGRCVTNAALANLCHPSRTAETASEKPGQIVVDCRREILPFVMSTGDTFRRTTILSRRGRSQRSSSGIRPESSRSRPV